MEQTAEVDEMLKYYVYVYFDPRDGKPFYIGKGQGNRYLSHLNEQSEKSKVKKIAEIRQANMEPRIEILRYGLSDSEAHLVEASAIDLIGRPPLTNIMSGHHPSFGRITSNELEMIINPKPGVIDVKTILITINQLYRSGMTSQELYEATRGIWRCNGPRRDRAEYAMAVYQGIVREVYRIDDWHPAGTLPYKTRESWDVSGPGAEGRWEFSGNVAADEIRNKYIGVFVGKGGQNPIRYVNV
jgi:uncharacterized protein